MDGFLGGYILTQTVRKSADILEQALPVSWAQHIEKMKAYINTEICELELEDREKSFTVIREAGLGTLMLNIYSTSVFIHAEENKEDHAVFAIRFEETPLLDLEKEQFDDFVETWTQFCQRAQASFGYFGRFSYVEDEEYLDSTFISALSSQNFEQLGYEFNNCWLQYYGPQILQNNQGRQVLAQSLEHVIQDYDYKAATLTNLDSGGMLFRSGPGPLDLGDEDE